MSKTVLIDGDSILYRVAFRGEELSEIDALDGEELMDYTVATAVGGVTEQPEITYQNSQVIRANSGAEAIDMYNEANNCEYYYGRIIGAVPTGIVSVFDDGMEDIANEGTEEYAHSGDYHLHLPTSYTAIDYAINKMVDAWVDKLIDSVGQVGIDGIEIYMTGKPGRLHCEDIEPNFRATYVESYKAERKDSRPPAGLPELWAYIFSLTDVSGVPVTVRVADGAEADDIVVYLKTTYPEKYLMCALDKDVLYQSAGHHYNYGKDEFVSVTELEAQRYLYFQMINGDPSDGYKGVPSVGKVGATKALKDLTTHKEMWDATLALYKKKGLGLGEAIQTGILASMRQVTSVEMDGYVAKPQLNIFKAVK